MDQLFYTPHIENGMAFFDEEESRHLVSVLRRSVGDSLRLTDGRGYYYEAVLIETGKKQAVARIEAPVKALENPGGRLHIAIAPTKQIERFEWFLEKSVEIGVDVITPLLCKRSERDVVRMDRLEKIVVSAMKQSHRAWLPELRPLTPFAQFILEAEAPQLFIPWIPEGVEQPLLQKLLNPALDAIVLIGPAGDFTPEEAASATARGYRGVSLGSARLRTETAGIYTAALRAALV